MRYLDKSSVNSVPLGKTIDFELDFKKISGLTKNAITSKPLVWFQFFKGQNGSTFNFLFKNHHETTRQREPRGDFGQNGVYWNYVPKCGPLWSLMAKGKPKVYNDDIGS